MTGQHAYVAFFEDCVEGFWGTIRRNWFEYALVMPIVLYLVVLVWYPFFRSFVMSFYSWPMFGEPTFVGLDNYAALLGSARFYQAVVATVLYGLQVPVQMVVGTVMALIAARTRRFTTVLGAIFLLPYILPPAVSGALSRFLFHPTVGTFTRILLDYGVLSDRIYWMNEGSTAMLVITTVGVWTWSPFVFLLVYAALQTVPQTHYEVARIYGANSWQRFWTITYPRIKSTLLVVLILRIIWNLGKVTQPLMITRGEPAGATTVLGILVYQLGIGANLGSSFATGVVVALVSVVFVAGFLYEFERTERQMGR